MRAGATFCFRFQQHKPAFWNTQRQDLKQVLLSVAAKPLKRKLVATNQLDSKRIPHSWCLWLHVIGFDPLGNHLSAPTCCWMTPCCGYYPEIICRLWLYCLSNCIYFGFAYNVTSLGFSLGFPKPLLQSLCLISWYWLKNCETSWFTVILRKKEILSTKIRKLNW